VAEYLDMQNQVLRQRLENAMQHWERGAEIQIQQFHARLDALLSANQQRLIALEEWRANGEDLAADTREGGFTDVVDGLQTDRTASQAESAIAAMSRQLDALEQQQAMEQGQHHAQGMGD